MTVPPMPPMPPVPPAPPARARASKRGPLIFALVVITMGLWLLLEAFGFNVPRFSRIWPIFLAVGGVASLLDYLTISRRPRSAGQAVLGVGLAAVCFVFSLGYAGWNETLDWLPAVPIVIGLAMLTTWLAAGKRDAGLFAGALVVLGIGLLGFFVRFDFLREWLPSAQIVWAISLLIVGVLVAWRVYGRND